MINSNPARYFSSLRKAALFPLFCSTFTPCPMTCQLVCFCSVSHKERGLQTGHSQWWGWVDCPGPWPLSLVWVLDSPLALRLWGGLMCTWSCYFKQELPRALPIHKGSLPPSPPACSSMCGVNALQVMWYFLDPRYFHQIEGRQYIGAARQILFWLHFQVYYPQCTGMT